MAYLNRPNRLLAYDWTIVRRSFQAAFSRPQDIVLLVLVGLVGFAFLRDTFRQSVGAGLPPIAWLGAAAPALIAFSGHSFVLARLRWFVGHSPLAGDALRPAPRAFYQLAAHLLLLILVLPCLWMLGLGLGEPLAVIGTGAGAYLGGVLLGGLADPVHRRLLRLADGPARPSRRPPAPASGRAAVLQLILRRQLGAARPWRRAVLVLAIGVAVPSLVGALHLFATATTAAIATLAFAFIGLMLLNRTDPEALAILPFAGYPPLFVAACHSAMPAGFAAAVALGVLLSPLPGAPVMLIGLGLGLAGLLIVGIASCWLYPGRSKRAVHLQVQLEFAALVLTAWLVPPAALGAIAWRMWALHRRGRALLWLQL